MVGPVLQFRTEVTIHELGKVFLIRFVSRRCRCQLCFRASQLGAYQRFRVAQTRLGGWVLLLYYWALVVNSRPIYDDHVILQPMVLVDRFRPVRRIPISRRWIQKIAYFATDMSCNMQNLLR